MVFTRRNVAVIWYFSTLKTCTEGCCSISDASLYPRIASKCCFSMYLSRNEVLVFLWSSSFSGGTEFPGRPLHSPSLFEHLPLSCNFCHSSSPGRLIPAGTSGCVLAEWWAEMRGHSAVSGRRLWVLQGWWKESSASGEDPSVHTWPEVSVLMTQSTLSSHSRQCIAKIIFFSLVCCFNFIKQLQHLW